jgi:glucokinase
MKRLSSKAIILNSDDRIVLTLDAGGTNFVFNAIQSNNEIAEPITLPSNAHKLETCIETIIEGFKKIINQLRKKPVAISFAFPGPADYKQGIVDNANNLPVFKGGVPLGSILRNKFNLPVFINNDGDLFAYGEALSGFLPTINKLLEESGNSKRYYNLLGLTLGTGFGAGIVRNGELYFGDNSIAAEVWLLRNRINPETNAEEGISLRAVKRVYAELTGTKYDNCPEPKEIYEIANDCQAGNKEAAVESFRQLGIVLGDAIANLLTVLDAMVVIGGGLAGAKSLIFPSMFEELSSSYNNYKEKEYPRLHQKVYNLDNSEALHSFLEPKERTILVPGTNEKLIYNYEAKLGIASSQLGTSQAIALGAYAYALNCLK